VPELWAQAVLWGNPVLLLFLNLTFGILWQLEQDNYGPALAISYVVVTIVLLAGCCHKFRSGTELEE